MKKISSYIWKYKWAYIGAIISMIIAVSLDMLAPQLTRLIIDRVAWDPIARPSFVASM